MEEKRAWPCWAPGKVTGATDGFLGFVRLTEQTPPRPHAASMTLSGSSAEPGGSWTFFP